MKKDSSTVIDKMPRELYDAIKHRDSDKVIWEGFIHHIVPLGSHEQFEVEQGIIKQLLYHPIPSLGVFMYAPLEENLPEPESV